MMIVNNLAIYCAALNVPFVVLYVFCHPLSVLTTLVVMGWAGNIWGKPPWDLSEHLGPVGCGAPACPNTQPCGLCE